MPTVISDFFGDQDPRVRTAALKAMVALARLGRTSDGPADLTLVLRACVRVFQLQLHERGTKIQQVIYEQVRPLFFFPPKLLVACRN